MDSPERGRSDEQKKPANCPHCAGALNGADNWCPACGQDVRSPSGVSHVIADDEGGLAEKLRVALAPHLLLLRPIGAGGMGTVFLARDPALKRLVAVKVLATRLATNPEARARFEREAQAVAGLSHPNVVAVYGVGELADGTPYFIMQYVSGPSMSARIDSEGSLRVPEVRRILGEVGAALAAAHTRGIIHRDIKPANILYEEETGRALVSDFGIAAVVERPSDPARSPRLTQTGTIIGTPQYMSPEQLLSEPVSEKTDVYALGLLGYELLTGKGPFQATSPPELIAAHLRDTPKRIAELREDVDPELDGLIARCLEKKPGLRPTALEVARRLAPGGGMLLEWPPPGLESLHGLLPRLSRLYWIGSLLVFAAAFPLLLRGTDLPSALTSITTVILLFIGAAGVVTLFVASRALLRAGAAVTRAVRAGYAWLTIAETTADRGGDTGNLITGSREFAALPATRRSRLRRTRALREMAILAGGVIAVPLLAVIIIMGSSGLLGVRATWLAVAIPFASLLTALAMASEERASIARRRAVRTEVARAGETAKLSGPWYETFEVARSGQPMGAGSRRRPSLAWTSALTIALATLVAMVLLVPLFVIGTVGPALWPMVLSKFGNTQEKANIAEVTRPFVVAKDSAITPLQAGRAFWALYARQAEPSRFPEHPRPIRPPAPWEDTMPAGLFPTARSTAYRGPDPGTILLAARKGFSSAEMAYLERLASAPHWKDFSNVARAPAVDVTGARLVLPFVDSVSILEMPVSKFSAIKGVAYAAVSRAAWLYATGQRDSAETMVREIVSVGLNLVDNAPTLLEALIGIVTVGVGRSALIQLYTLDGNPAGPRLQRQHDSAIAVRDEGVAVGSSGDEPITDFASPRAVRRSIITLASDRRKLRGLRMEMLLLLGVAPCTNVQELVFGPSGDIRDAFQRARREMARFASDSAILDLLYTSPERGADPGAGSIGTGLLIGASRVSGTLMNNRRLTGCVELLAQSQVIF